MCCVVYDFFTLENLSQIAQIIIATGAVVSIWVSIWQIIKNKKKDEAMLNTIEKQKQFYEMQIAEKKKEQEEKEKQERFEKMLSFTLHIIVTISNYHNCYNTTIEFDGNNCDSENFFNTPTDSLTTYWKVIHKIYFLNIGSHWGNVRGLYFFNDYSLRHSLATKKSSTYEVWKDFGNLINDDAGIKVIDILKQELPKILTPYVFDGEKLIVKDE